MKIMIVKKWGKNCYFYETSVKLNINCKECFNHSIRLFRKLFNMEQEATYYFQNIWYLY